ncbi:DNA polymerase I [Sulfurifustis variabilis]|uniref:DNA polymerase I n=1 Tax=Sulfurifustis variabilis TaxID=1675686 RepID=A0A1B4VC26_9GAMM|nr:DNA polymerase I [Sulfurifustis variabilis]BAU50404.1 DNA polymerase I [Sulfurifustis variabilis]
MPRKKPQSDGAPAPARKPEPADTPRRADGANTLVLVDGSSYLYRAFHAMPSLTNSRGEATGAVYGVTNMLRKLLADYDPAYVAVVFDAKGRTFRDDVYPEYKANRPPMPDALSAQIEPIHEIVRALGFPLLQIDNVEADDVIGTLARLAASQGMSTLVSTGDKDMTQLVDGHVTLVNTMTGTVYDRAKVIEKFGVPPERIIDFLALVGDSVDNIPGVPGVGPKTAARWLAEHGSLEAVIAGAAGIPGKVGDSLRAALPVLPLARELATIKCDVPLALGPRDLKRLPPDTARLRELYSRLEFRTWLAELGGVNPPASTTVPGERASYETVLDQAALERWLERLAGAELFALGTEATSPDAPRAELVGIAFTVRAGEGAYVPLAHAYPGAPEQLDRDAVLARLKPLLEDERRSKVGHNLKYATTVLANCGIALRGVAYDTMLESYVLDSTASRHDMESLALKYLGYKTVKYEDVAGKGKAQINFREVAIEQAAAYAGEDADLTLRLHACLWPRLEQNRALVTLFRELELPLVAVLSRMERNGVRIDVEMLRRQSGELAHRMLEIEREAHSAAGQPFNLDSPKQIQEILFRKLALPVLRKTPTGQPSTGEDVLAELALDYPLPRLILEYRSLAKLKSTYTDKLPEMINPATGRVHTCYHQAVAATGRLSSSDPNLQNIPVRTAEGRRIRQAFVPEPGYRIVSADYSQIELRIMAHLSGDPGLIQAFAAGQDIHRATAAEVFGLPPDQVPDEMRRAAKAINFGLIYGMSAFGLSRQLKIDRAAAQQYVDLYFARYPGVKAFMDRTREQARTRGYVETLFGRRLHLPDINAPNVSRRQGAERAAINAPMQGTAADLIKRAMLAVDRWITESRAPVRMIMQVHDELVFEVAEGFVETAIERVRDAMATVATLEVPLVVDVGVGANWDEAH